MTAALLPSLRLLHALAFLLLRLSAAASSSRAPEPPPEQPAAGGCSPSPKACGGLNVSDPFWLEEPGRPPCGSPPFQLKCNASGAFLTHSVFQAYRVVAIFARNSSVHVVDENLPLADGCPAPCFNISLAMTLGAAFVISEANSELRFLSRCSEPAPEAVPGFRRLPCDNESFVGFGGRFGSSSRFDRAIPPGCLVSVVPTLPAPAPPDGHGHGHDYVASMRRGFSPGVDGGLGGLLQMHCERRGVHVP